MNVIQYIELINKPFSINSSQTTDLNTILEQFPYFQSARALRLKGLFNQESYSYNNHLKITAAHSTDRSVLFDFITSNTFTSIQKGLYEKKILELHNFDIIDLEVVLPQMDFRNSLEDSILKSIENASEKTTFESVEKKLEIGKPIEFSENEKHSFQEWLQLSRIKPIKRDDIDKNKPIFEEIDLEKQKKINLIDQFIENNPKIPMLDKNITIPMVNEQKSHDNSYLMTETLAKVYLEQKKYDRAIQAYEILILKYPEKFSFFASRISDIKIIQQNNN
jgi:tetratricopeptide (TPR) repeat protein